MRSRLQQLAGIAAVVGLSLSLMAMPSFARTHKSKKSKTATTAQTSSSQSSQPASPKASSSDMVWVNPSSKVFHVKGDRWYGKTKNGKYMTESEALKEGYHEARHGGHAKKAKP